ncbi:hypothetical protein AB0D14_33485 [Streptomyces sp. NPDC048484]|uniref:alcohol dehydrogenase catalytic domain-containing protein n=1 Tax=Streptomyces sp. NPDC048484 TaxID=3155146 RepID=UPI0034306D0E
MPGIDVAGKVAGLGDGVKGFGVGDAVVGFLLMNAPGAPRKREPITGMAVSAGTTLGNGAADSSGFSSVFGVASSAEWFSL